MRRIDQAATTWSRDSADVMRRVVTLLPLHSADRRGYKGTLSDIVCLFSLSIIPPTVPARNE